MYDNHILNSHLLNRVHIQNWSFKLGVRRTHKPFSPYPFTFSLRLLKTMVFKLDAVYVAVDLGRTFIS